MKVNIPTAAFRLLQWCTRKITKNMLTPHAAMLATLEIDPSVFIRGMPHDGLIPTGADEVGIERFVSVSEEERSS